MGTADACECEVVRAPGLTVKLPLVPDLLEPDVEIVTPEPAPVTVTEPVQTPLEKVPVVVGLIVPVETLKRVGSSIIRNDVAIGVHSCNRYAESCTGSLRSGDSVKGEVI